MKSQYIQRSTATSGTVAVGGTTAYMFSLSQNKWYKIR